MKNFKRTSKLSQGRGFFTHPPLIYSKAVWAYYDLNKRKKLKKGINNILDLGCAQGIGPLFASVFFTPKKIVGVDSDIKAISKANKNKSSLKLKNCFFILDKIESFFRKENNLKNKNYDIIIANGVLPYILNKKELIYCLKGISKTLNKRGIFCFTMFGDDNPKRKMGYIKKINSFSPNTKLDQLSRITSKKEMLEILKNANLTVYKNGLNYIKKYNLTSKKKIEPKPYSYFYEFITKKI